MLRQALTSDLPSTVGRILSDLAAWLCRPRPVRTLLFLMTLALVIPALLFSVYLVKQFADLQRSQTEQRLAQVAAELADNVDRDFERLLTLLDTLALSDRLKLHDFSGFHAQATLAVKRAGTYIAIADGTGQQLMNTRVPYGTPLPKPPIPLDQQRALASGKPFVSDVVLGAISHKWVYGLTIPLNVEGLPNHSLVMVIDASHLLDIMTGLHLPADWMTGISDRADHVVARSKLQEEFVGRPLAADIVSAMQGTPGTAVETLDMSGVPTVRAIARSKVSGWNISAIIPQALVEAEIRRSQLALAWWGLALLGLALAMAAQFARWIIAPMQALASTANVLQKNDIAATFVSPMAEANAVAQSLRLASTELKSRAARLRQSEERLHLAQRTARLAYVDLELGQKTAAVSETFEELFGFRPPTDDPTKTIQSVLERVHPDDRERVRAARTLAVATLGAYEDEFRIVLPNGEIRWISAHGETLGDAAGVPVRMIGTNLDITRRKEQEGNIQFLLREVSHRSKNLLAIIQAMATQTGRSSRNYDEFQSRFSQRLQGMSASHDLLVSQNWQGADLAALVRAQLRPFAEESSGRIELAGPLLVLTPVAAQSIGMALHELATNATKYGALSAPQGKVAVSWQVLPDTPGAKFQMTWRERGGPAVEPPGRNGFGHMVFDRMVKQALNASIAVGYPQEGFVWTIDTALASVTDSAA